MLGNINLKKKKNILYCCISIFVDTVTQIRSLQMLAFGRLFSSADPVYSRVHKKRKDLKI